MDPSLSCNCARCLCTLKVPTNAAGTALPVGAGAGHPETYTKITALNDATVVEMKKLKSDQKKLNEGSWLRAINLRNSATKDVIFTTKLSVLHPFFSIEAYFPMRNVITFECSMKEDRAMLWRSATDTEDYRIEVKSIELRLLYCTFEQRLRERYV